MRLLRHGPNCRLIYAINDSGAPYLSSSMWFAQIAPPALIPRHLTTVDYVVVVVYFAVTLLIGSWCVKRRSGSSNDFFLGGGRVAWWALALSMFATGTSSISFMAL